MLATSAKPARPAPGCGGAVGLASVLQVAGLSTTDALPQLLRLVLLLACRWCPDDGLPLLSTSSKSAQPAHGSG